MNLKKLNLAVLLITILVLVPTIQIVYASSLSTFYLSGGIYPNAVSYTIWREGSNYYAKNAYGYQPSWSGSTNASQVTQNALNAMPYGGTILFKTTANYWTYYDFDTPLTGVVPAWQGITLKGESSFVTLRYTGIDHDFITLGNSTHPNGLFTVESLWIITQNNNNNTALKIINSQMFYIRDFLIYNDAVGDAVNIPAIGSVGIHVENNDSILTGTGGNIIEGGMIKGFETGLKLMKDHVTVIGVDVIYSNLYAFHVAKTHLFQPHFIDCMAGSCGNWIFRTETLGRGFIVTNFQVENKAPSSFIPQVGFLQTPKPNPMYIDVTWAGSLWENENFYVLSTNFWYEMDETTTVYKVGEKWRGIEFHCPANNDMFWIVDEPTMRNIFNLGSVPYCHLVDGKILGLTAGNETNPIPVGNTTNWAHHNIWAKIPSGTSLSTGTNTYTLKSMYCKDGKRVVTVQYKFGNSADSDDVIIESLGNDNDDSVSNQLQIFADNVSGSSYELQGDILLKIEISYQ